MFQVFSYLFLIFLIHNITGNKNVHVALRFPESIIHRSVLKLEMQGFSPNGCTKHDLNAFC